MWGKKVKQKNVKCKKNLFLKFAERKSKKKKLVSFAKMCM